MDVQNSSDDEEDDDSYFEKLAEAANRTDDMTSTYVEMQVETAVEVPSDTYFEALAQAAISNPSGIVDEDNMVWQRMLRKLVNHDTASSSSTASSRETLYVVNGEEYLLLTLLQQWLHSHLPKSANILTMISSDYLLHGYKHRTLYIDDKTHPSIAIITEHYPVVLSLKVTLFQAYDNYAILQAMLLKILFTEKQNNPQYTFQNITLCGVDMITDELAFQRLPRYLTFQWTEVCAM